MVDGDGNGNGVVLLGGLRSLEGDWGVWAVGILWRALSGVVNFIAVILFPTKNINNPKQ